ncbi:hypothetical protein N0V91_006633 [Didymella pomorum]|uniref:Uncharacterized protein n=1 Tax=Didymella pomorum TaxID=749634 RepID=A0A9W9D773_9PLEO|nr:hypothetical protein N0V91_006633 [Didymella pomorum]
MEAKTKNGKLAPFSEAEKQMSKQVKANDKATSASSSPKQTTRASQPSAHPLREFSGPNVDKLPTADELDEFTAISQGLFGSTTSHY